LTIEDPNTIDSELVDALPPIPLISAPLCKPKWEKRLPKLLSISALDAQGTSLLLPVEIGTTDTSELHSVEALLDCGATGSLIDRDFVHSKGMNIRTLSHNIPVFNVDSFPNEAGQISEVVDVVLRYKTHSERMLLAVSRLGKQNLILGYDWLKDYNPKIDWEKGKVEMTHCPLCCEGGRALRKEQTRQKRIELRALRSCRDRPTPLLQEKLEPKKEPLQTHHLSWELRDRLFLTRLLPEPDPVDLRATTTTSQCLAEEARRSTETQAAATLLPTYVMEFRSVFAKEDFDMLPEHCKWDHAIELTSGAEPKSSKVYPLSPLEQAELDAFLEENLRTGRIRPSKSSIAAPVFFIKKKDGSLCLVQDYRALNAVTVKNRYPLPLISELVSQLRGAQYFTKLDVRWGFNNVCIKPRDEWKAAFCTNRGLFEPLVMFFGMTNSPAIFQTMMNDIFRTVIAEGIVVVYLDDILIFTKTEEEHERAVQRVLEILAEHKLFLCPEKCEFHRKQIEYLGLVISENKVAMDPVKVAGVHEWPVPENRTNVQAFIGFVNFYHRFIQDFSTIARPLFDLTRSDQAWNWGTKEQEAFEHLKMAVTTASILALPQDLEPFHIEADSSDFASGAVLSQQLPGEEKWHPVAFYSKSLSPVERNYEIHDKEMLAIIHALEEWRHFLEGARHPVEI